MQTPWYQQTEQQVLDGQQVDAARGLSEREAAERLARFGENALKQGKKRTVLAMLLDQLKDFMVLVLIAAAVIAGLLGETTDAVIILVVVVLNAILGVVQENRAEKSLDALKRMASPHAKALREGTVRSVEAATLVPGDVVLLEAGDCVPADIRLVEVYALQVQEAALTGESVPVEKASPALAGECTLGDRVNMAFSGSMVTYGRAVGVVVETGMGTEIGHIAGLMQQEEGVQTPLQHRLEAMGKTLGWVCLGISALVFVTGVLYGHEVLEMFMRAVALAVAAIPEGLPATVTIVLAIGVQRMSRKHAIIRRLPAVETLGSATVICSDKTGTLTLNRMTVTHVVSPFEQVTAEQAVRQPNAVLLATAAVLCNDGSAAMENGQTVWLGDPTETALLVFGARSGYERPRLEERMPRVDEVPFDSERKRMTTVHREQGALRSFSKGAVDELLPHCTLIYDGGLRPLTPEDCDRILAVAADMAQDALRVLAFATGELPALAERDKVEAYENGLAFLGLMGMIDPAREEVKPAVARCRQAGIKPVMITGDHQVTASAIAEELGILREGDRVMTGAELEKLDDAALREVVREVAVYARVSPEHKLRIVRAWQSWGDVVAMTGDGVNDAPALKRADIGVAMGITGTEVSKEASAMILTDDNFSTIVSAVEEGRTIYANILKAIQLLLGCNIGEVLVIFLATLLNWGSPLLPIHLLWVNLVTDSLPALALGMEAPQADTMNRPPQDPKAPLFSGPLVLRLLYQGVMVAALTIAAFLLGSAQGGLSVGQTMSFAVLSFTQLVQALNGRSTHLSLFRLGLGSNRWLAATVVLMVGLQLLLLFVPPLREIFKLALLTPGQWGIVAGLSLAPLAVVESMKALGWNGEKLR